jgi:hypothetical protein
MRKILSLMLILVLFIQGCSLFRGSKQEAPVARVFEQYLYPSDLVEVIPEGSSAEDSVILAKRYIDGWVKDQLMVHRAEQALTEEQKDFERRIAEYHRSLLIYTYRQKLLQQKLDTVVTEEEVQQYYEENLNNFLLAQDVIRGTYVKVAQDAPRISELRRWSWNNRPEDLDNMEKYSLSYAEKYDDFNESWVYFSSIKAQFPMTISNPSSFLSYNKNLETSDEKYRYFLHISAHLPEGEPAPVELVHNDIVSIILNKRKIEFFQDMEQRIYSDGVSRNQFEIYETGAQ